MKVYAADTIDTNTWLYDATAANGILGYGQNSPFWNQYVDQQGNAYYSIKLANLTIEEATSN